jgi:hypothetical protein
MFIRREFKLGAKRTESEAEGSRQISIVQVDSYKVPGRTLKDGLPDSYPEQCEIK